MKAQTQPWRVSDKPDGFSFSSRRGGNRERVCATGAGQHRLSSESVSGNGKLSKSESGHPFPGDERASVLTTRLRKRSCGSPELWSPNLFPRLHVGAAAHSTCISSFLLLFFKSGNQS